MQRRNTLLIVLILCATGCGLEPQSLTDKVAQRYNACKNIPERDARSAGEFDFKTGLCSCGGTTCERVGMVCNKHAKCFEPDCLLEGDTRCIVSEELGAVQETCHGGKWSGTAKCKSERCNPKANKCEEGTNSASTECIGTGPVCINGNSYDCAAGEDPKLKEKCKNGCKNGECKADSGTPCQKNTTRCEDNQLQVCVNGSFQNKVACQNGCEGNKCKCSEECEDKCDEIGKCPPACEDSDKYYCKEGIVYDCKDTSEKGARFCTNGVLYSCDSSGNLIPDNCPSGLCADNACAECKNGELKCVGEVGASARSELKQCIHGKYRDVSCYYGSDIRPTSFDLCSKVPTTDVNLKCEFTSGYKSNPDDYKNSQGCKLITLSNAEEHRYQLEADRDHYDVTYYGKADESSVNESSNQCRCNRGTTKCQVSTDSRGEPSCKLMTCHDGNWKQAKDAISCVLPDVTCGECLNATYSHKKDSKHDIYAVCYNGKNYNIKCLAASSEASRKCTIESDGKVFKPNTKYKFCNGNNKIYFEVPEVVGGTDISHVSLTNCQAGLQEPPSCDFDCKNINNEGNGGLLLPKE